MTSLRVLALGAALAACLAAAPPSTVIVVRHAEVAARTTDPPLSEAGMERGQALASMLAASGVKAIYVTEFTRTQQTAQPLAERLKLKPARIDASKTAALVDAVRAVGTGPVLIVGHSNTIPDIIAALGGPRIAIAATEYDGMFVLSLSAEGTSFVRLRYGKESSASAEPAATMK
jgi:broad specificity phosphatase PhoE